MAEASSLKMEIKYDRESDVFILSIIPKLIPKIPVKKAVLCVKKILFFFIIFYRIPIFNNILSFLFEIVYKIFYIFKDIIYFLKI